LTRELGANDAIKELLHGLDCIELPCIAFGNGPDTDKLASAIPQYDIISITSPQAASVFLKAWESIDKPKVQVVTVGKGTAKPLIAAGITPAFQPSEFTAEVLAAELPESLGKRVLYPSSAIAENVLQSGLEARGFQVTRLNTYDTVPATWTDEDFKTSKTIDIVTFASPSAIRIWTERCGSDQIAVVIGPTSLEAAKKCGFSKVYAPQGSKGLQAWADKIREVALSLKTNNS
jgi:uroporphyrinogen-III synthase